MRRQREKIITRLHAQTKVTPLSSPRSAAGIPLAPVTGSYLVGLHAQTNVIPLTPDKEPT